MVVYHPRARLAQACLLLMSYVIRSVHLEHMPAAAQCKKRTLLWPSLGMSGLAVSGSRAQTSGSVTRLVNIP